MILPLYGMLLVPPMSPPEVDEHDGPLVPVVPARMSRELAEAFEQCEVCALTVRAAHEREVELEIVGPRVGLTLRFGLEKQHASRLWARAKPSAGGRSIVRIALCPDPDVALRLTLAPMSSAPEQLLEGCRHFAPAVLVRPTAPGGT